jgi:hypothetical protein
MAKFDERNGKEYALALSTTLDGTTKAEGTWIDMQGYESLTFVVATGTITDAGTASGFSFQVEEGDTTADASATAVADADLIGTESALTVTDDDTDNTLVGSIGYRGDKRYVRMTATGTTGTDGDVHVVAIKGRGTLQGTASIDSGTAAT